MRILVLGGSVFLGHTVATVARDAGHEVSCLARGESGSLPAGTRHVAADRSSPGAYDAVRDQDWDAVVDVSWQPGFVRGALAALAPRAEHWTYVSSCSVYATQDTPGADESAPLLEPLAADEATREEYGAAKAACEQACLETLGDRLHVARAGLIAGPGDRSDRLGYWPGRFARGGNVLVPAEDQAAQVVDVRDLATYLLAVAERGDALVANAVGERLRLQAVLAAAREVAGHRTEPVRASDDWLVGQGVEPYMGDESLPLWMPLPDWGGFNDRADERAVAAGLVRRPVADTLADALDDERRLGLDRQPRRAGLSPAREAELVAAWRAHG